jgi:hypothetical protein
MISAILGDVHQITSISLFLVGKKKKKAKSERETEKVAGHLPCLSHAQLAVSYPEKSIEYLAYLVTFCLVGP